VGKETLAHLAVQTLLCTAPEAGARPCGACRACRLVRQRTHPDEHVLASPLRIDAVRELQRVLPLAPNEAAWRVVVLTDVDDATPAASNCLLKTLEEPPSHAVLLLTASNLDAVLPTVKSRSQIVLLHPLPVDQVAQLLVAHWSADAEQAALLARLSGGRIGWAVAALTEPAVMTRRAQWLDRLTRALAAGPAERMAIAAEMAKESDELSEGLATWGTWWRDLLLLHHGVTQAVTNRDALGDLEANRLRFAGRQIVEALRALQDAVARLAANANPLLTLELLVLELPS
jgi:DNA polymerase-3 subunit delta'